MNVKTSIVFQKNWNALDQGKRILLNEGSSRSSKTWSFFLIIYLFAMKNYRSRILALRDTAVSCRDIVESEFKDWAADPMDRMNDAKKGKISMKKALKLMEKENLLKHLEINMTKHRYTFPNGSTITFTGADNITKIIGKQNDLVWVNEPYKFPKEVMTQLLKRLEKALLIDWNPSSDLYIDDYKSRPDCIVIHSTFRDNPFLKKEVRDEILGSKPLANKYFKPLPVAHYIKMSPQQVISDLESKGVNKATIREVLMCWHNENNKTADEYQWDVYGLGVKAEKPNRIFKWKQIPDHAYHDLEAVKYYGVDWGAVDPMGIVEMKYYDGALYCHEKSYDSENQIKKSLTATQRAQISEEDEGFIKWYFRQLDLDQDRPFICDNNRPRKITALQKSGYDYAMKAAKGKGSIIDGIDLLNSLPVFYTESSLNIHREQQLYERAVDRYGVVLDDPVDTNNHLIDPIRYVAQWLQDEEVINIIA